MYKLLIEDDEGGQTAVSLIRDEITIGRKEGNTIRLTDRNVSRRHGRIVREDDRVYVEDVAARYGIKKNGTKIDERSELKAGDVVLIGDYRLTLQAEKKAKKKKAPPAKAPPAKKGKAGPKGPPKKPEGLSDDFSESPKEQTQIMQAMPAKLVVISSNFAGKEFPLASKELVVGRGDDCNIIIDHRSISSRHAKIVREDNTTYKIVDLNSKNGVKVSGETYRATLLKRGDVIELGHVKFRFVEPGENYVFDPKSVEKPAPSMAVSKSDSGLDTKTMGLIVGAVVAVVLGIGAVMVIGGADDEEAPTEVVEDEDALADIDEIEEQGDEGIDDAIADARAEIESGELGQPVTRLETISSVMDLSSGQQDDIDDLLSQARNEQPFKRHYQNALGELEGGDPLAALNEATSIPRHSLFYNKLADQGLIEEIFDATLDVGRSAMEDDDLEEARDMADEVLMAGSDYDPALELHDAIDAREDELAEARAQQEAEREAAQAQADDTGSAGSDDAAPAQPSPSPEPSSPSADSGSDSGADDPREMYTQAAREVAGGNPEKAIDICQTALDAGHIDCHRILGLAYSRLGDSSNACRHFEEYLATGPANPGPVESQMENHDCAP